MSTDQTATNDVESTTDADAAADAKGILIIVVTAVLFALHFVSGWSPDL